MRSNMGSGCVVGGGTELSIASRRAASKEWPAVALDSQACMNSSALCWMSALSCDSSLRTKKTGRTQRETIWVRCRTMIAKMTRNGCQICWETYKHECLCGRWWPSWPTPAHLLRRQNQYEMYMQLSNCGKTPKLTKKTMETIIL